jgi:hypothetical protein
MLSNVILLIEGCLLPLAAFWIFILWIRPAVARARVEREVLAIRDRVVDARARGDIDSTNPRAVNLVELCEFVATDPREITLSNLLSFQWAVTRAGVDTGAEAKIRAEKIARESSSNRPSASYTTPLRLIWFRVPCCGCSSRPFREPIGSSTSSITSVTRQGTAPAVQQAQSTNCSPANWWQQLICERCGAMSRVLRGRR